MHNMNARFFTSVYIGEKQDSFIDLIASELQGKTEVLDDGILISKLADAFFLSIIRETVGKISVPMINWVLLSIP